MRYFDLHCDTVSKMHGLGCEFNDQRLALGFDSLCGFEKREQCFALWLDDSLKDKYAFNKGKKLLVCYRERLLYFEDKIENMKMHLSGENGEILGGKIENIKFWKNEGMRMLSLTWNGENSLGYGAMSENKGLKPFGRQCLKEMERLGIFCDVSHLSEEGFRDVCRLADKPFVASHSSSSAVFPHRRNLKDWQIKEIIRCKGLIGLCFYSPFLGTGKVDVFGKIYENICHILSLGGEDILCIGSDFDGAKMDKEIDKGEKVKNLYSYLKKKNLGDNILEKIFYTNAKGFFG